MNTHEKEAWQRMANNLDAISTDTKYTSALRYASEIIHELIAEVERIDAERDALAAQLAQAQRELAAVPVDAMRLLLWGDATQPGYANAVGTVGDWLIAEQDAANGATPTPGARLKYGTERTEQHSVTLPASLWRWVEELGDGNRSAGTAKGLLAALNGEREGVGR